MQSKFSTKTFRSLAPLTIILITLHSLARFATSTSSRSPGPNPSSMRLVAFFRLPANDKLCAFCTVFEFNSLTNHKVKFMFATCECHYNDEDEDEDDEDSPYRVDLQSESSNRSVGLFI